MSFRDILAMVLSAEADAGALAAAEALAESNGAKATALLLEIQPDPVFGVDVYVVSEVWAQVLARAHEGFLEEKAKLEARLARPARPMALRSVAVPLALTGARASVEARYADIVVMARPDDETRKAMFEGALFGSGRPVLLAPPAWTKGGLGRSIAIGWNAGREATRALADAEPFLDRAETITIITVDAKPSWSGHGEAPGADIAAHLARRGLKVEVRNVDGLGRSEGAALLDECGAIGADLLVVGGYGHARLQEIVFGGVTREVITSSPIPVFMSH
jgi:nucleotide-binding universal stress UspA family protein